MKIAGILFTALGALMLLSGVNVAVTQYDLSDSHDLGKFIGSAAVSTVLLALGLMLLGKSRKPPSSRRGRAA